MSTRPPARPRILDALGEELVRAARAQEAAEAATPRARRRARRRAWRPVVVAVALLLLLAAVAIAATLVIGRGDPIPAPPHGAVPSELQPAPGTARLAGLQVADPDGGPAWDVRTARSRTGGAVCLAVGQVVAGELGIVGLDRRFHALPAGAADTCSAPQRSGATLAGARALRGGAGGQLRDLTVVNGVAGRDVVRAVAISGDGRTRVPLRLAGADPERAFLAIFRGRPEVVRPRLVLTDARGRATTLRFDDTGEYTAPDPSGGAPWTLTSVTRHLAPGLRCVQGRRERGPDSPLATPGVFNFAPAQFPVRCGARDRAFAWAQRFVPAVWRTGTFASVWGVNPSRTLVWGAVPDVGAQVTVAAAGAPPRSVDVDPHTYGFLAVFPGATDPRSVRVSVDGRPVSTASGNRNRLGRPLAPPRTPPRDRSVASVVRAAPHVGFTTDRATARVVRHATDPTGGPAWALRTVRATGVVGPNGSGHVKPFTCLSIGQLGAGGRLTEPLVGGATRTVGFDEGDLGCNEPAWLATHLAPPAMRVYVDDARSANPQPERVVVSGLLGSGVRSAQLLGVGAPRRLALGADGTYLLVLEGRFATARAQIRVVRADGRTETSHRGSLGTGGCRPQGPAFTVADPAGGAPWVTGRGMAGRSRCQYSTRLVGGRHAYIEPDRPIVHFGISGWSVTGLRGGAQHATLEVSGPGSGPAFARSTAPTSGDVLRRTLPGRTVVSGSVPGDVASVTLRTPRDIRTIVPVDGTFLAVYDGPFYNGEVVLTARHRDGRPLVLRRRAALPY